jgi:hypothetical protein
MNELKNKISAGIFEIQKEINGYDDAQYRFDVLVNPGTGNVERGDLHINCNSWTQWHSTDGMYTLSLYPAYTTEYRRDVEASNGNYDIDDACAEAWEDAALAASGRYADELAEAIVNGDNIEDIRLEIIW